MSNPGPSNMSTLNSQGALVLQISDADFANPSATILSNTSAFYQRGDGSLWKSNGNGYLVGMKMDLPLTLVEGRGDSFEAGTGVTPVDVYGYRFAQAITTPQMNYGVGGSGVLTQYINMTNGTSRPLQNDGRMTVTLNAYNEMRQGVTTGRKSAFRGALASTLLLMASRWYGLRQNYNGRSGLNDGAPAGSFAVSGTWALSNYGSNNVWRGVISSTQTNTCTAQVQGSVVYICYTKQKTNNGGTFSVTIDGTIVLSSVSCDGTGYALVGSETTTADSNGYPNLLRIPTTAGRHTVVVTVTSATGATNPVGIEYIAGNDDCIGNTVIVGACCRQNAAGYLAAPANYASLAIGDAAVAQYQQIQSEVIAQFAADGFDIYYADTSAYDPTIPSYVQSDNLHPTVLAQGVLTSCLLQAYFGQHLQKNKACAGDIQNATTPASLAAYQNTTRFDQEVFLTGGTVTNVEFSRDGVTWFSAATTTPARVWLNPSDQLRTTYTVAPTTTVVPR